MNQNKLPADPLSLILGILALVIGVAGCCCYGITAIIPLAMAIIGLVAANRSLREFGENPEAYNPQTRSNVNTAKIINIIAIVLNSLIFLLAIGVLIFYGSLFSAGLMEGLKEGRFGDEIENSGTQIEWEADSSNTWTEEGYIIEEDYLEIEVEELEVDSSNADN